MKRISMLLFSSLIFTTFHVASPSSLAASTINVNTNQQSSYGANIGWMNWRGDTTNGVVASEFWLSGHIWGANVGWIKVGATSVPPNNIAWQNTVATNFGVNIVGGGELRGFAYGANIGWLVFTNRHAGGLLLESEIPRLNYKTGNFTGFAYGANVGWISLSNAFARVKTDIIQNAPDTDSDTIADAWELQFSGSLATLGTATTSDFDGDGKSDRDEYVADTSPILQSDYLRIIALSANSAGSTSVVTWTSELSRCYGLDTRTNLLSGTWTNTLLDAGTGVISPDPSNSTTRTAGHVATSNRFFQVRAFKPLTP